MSANARTAVGDALGLQDGDELGLHDGEALGLHDGDVLGPHDGDELGLHDGDVLGLHDGEALGLQDGDVLGLQDGDGEPDGDGQGGFPRILTVMGTTWLSLPPMMATVSVPVYVPEIAFCGTTSTTATLLVFFGSTRPPVASLAKVTLRMKGAIAPLALNETWSGIGALDVTRKTSHQLLELGDLTSPKSSDSSPCLLNDATRTSLLQPELDVWIACEQPRPKLRYCPQLPVEIWAGIFADVVNQALAVSATSRVSAAAAARTVKALATVRPRRAARAARGAPLASGGGARTVRNLLMAG